jgi:DNA invertase Pin-like site-specific DNA recombinase
VFDRSADGRLDSRPESAIEEWAAEHGYRIVAWYEDGGISGWKSDREAFQR